MEAKRLAMNLRTLQRHDASITEIVDSASYVVLYRYAPKAGGSDETGEPEMAWVRCVCPRMPGLCMLIRSTMGSCRSRLGWKEACSCSEGAFDTRRRNKKNGV